jgi:hypothetical protein
MKNAGFTGFVYLSIRLYGVTCQNGIIVIFPGVRNTSLINSVVHKPGLNFNRSVICEVARSTQT